MRSAVPPGSSPRRVTVRRANPGEFVDCIRVAHAAWPDFAERNSIYHLFTKYFTDTSVVADADGQIVGFVFGFQAGVAPPIGYLHLVAVDPAHQRAGVATRLYEEVFAVLRSRGCRVVRCIVNPENSRSLRFHTGMGFVPTPSGPTVAIGGVEATRDYNGPGSHMVEFERPL
jgi:ribosomal protein S18 acetylase RimI-like enzyme